MQLSKLTSPKDDVVGELKSMRSTSRQRVEDTIREEELAVQSAEETTTTIPPATEDGISTMPTEEVAPPTEEEIKATATPRLETEQLERADTARTEELQATDTGRRCLYFCTVHCFIQIWCMHIGGGGGGGRGSADTDCLAVTGVFFSSSFFGDKSLDALHWWSIHARWWRHPVWFLSQASLCWNTLAQGMSGSCFKCATIVTPTVKECFCANKATRFASCQELGRWYSQQ